MLKKIKHSLRGNLVIKEKEFLCVKDLVEMGLCSQSQAYNLMHAKGFPSVRIFGAWRVRKADLNKWIDQQKAN